MLARVDTLPGQAASSRMWGLPSHVGAHFVRTACCLKKRKLNWKCRERIGPPRSIATVLAVFVFALGDSTHHRARFMRAKAFAERAVREASLSSTVFAPSIVYAPGDAWLTLLERRALLPVIPVSGRGRALYQPMWAEDAADCVLAALREPERDGHARYALARPETLSHNDIVRTVLRSLNRSRPLVHVPAPIVSLTPRLLVSARPTRDEAELMEVSMTSSRGPPDAESLGVAPQRMAAVLGSG